MTQPVTLGSSAAVTSILDCNNDTDGQVTASGSGGTTPYTFSWNTGGTAALETSLGAGTYSVTITDQNGCTDSSSVTMTQPAVTGSSASVTSILDCNNDTDGQVTASGSGGTTPYTFSWNTGGTAALETSLGAGTYSVTITDQNGCTDSTSVILSQPAATVSSAAVTSNINCNGYADGQVTASSTGGTTPYTFSWNTGGTAALETGLGSGTYSVTITDQNGCTDSSSVVLSQPAVTGSSAAVTSILDCNNDTDGQVTASGSGGTTPYTFSWNTGGTAALETSLGAGTYSVTITDQNGCTDSTSVILSQPAATVSSAAVTSIINCNGYADGQVTASSTGGTTPYTFSWNTGGTAALETGLGSGTYSVTITDQNGCTDSSSVVLSEPASLIASSAVTSAVNCNGLTDGQVTASSTGGTSPYTFSWNTGGTAALETNLGAGTYSVTITDQNGCTDSASVVVSEPVVLVASATTNSNASSFGNTDGQITGSSTGGTSPFTYTWNNGGTGAVETNVGAGTYSITITDQNGCTDSASTMVTQPPAFNSSTFVDSNVSCNGFADGGATASPVGGTSPFTYAWSNSATTASITGVVAGTYTVTMTDGLSITSTSSVTITQPASLMAAAVVDANVSCNSFSDGGATASVTGGTMPYTYAWSNAATTASIVGVVAGTYTTTITDANGCTSTSSATVTEPVTFVAATVVDSNTTCNGNANGGATASATGGTMPYTYAWSNAATTASITGVMAGTYTTTITDANGCSSTSSATVTEPTSLMASSVVDSNISCNGFADGGATASAIGGTAPYTYAWSNSATTSSITGVIAGTYSVTIADMNGCTSASSVTVVEPVALVSASVVDSNTTCNGLSDGGASASATGGTMPYTYSWSNSATTASITGVVAGTYSVTIMDANGCSSTSAATVTEPVTLVAASVVNTNISCNGYSDGGATASATGGTMPYTYAWSNAATTASITGVVAGTYTTTITDANGCSSTSSATVTEPVMLTATAVIDNHVSLFGLSDGQATGSATGGTSPYTYTWSNSATTATITGVIAGTYSVTITDQNGCTDSTSATINQPPSFGAFAVVDSNISCNGLADGGATASPIGGTSPFNYAWSNSATTASITGVVAGTYTVTMTDGLSITSTSSVTITQPATLTAASVVDSNTTCNGFANGGVTSSATGGTTPYTYAWSNAATTASITGVVAGTYTTTITDANGCSSTSSATVTEPASLVAATVVDSNTTCNGYSDGGATASATGGTMPYTYSWSNSATTASITGVVAGTYTTTITDANGCTTISSATVTEPVILAAATIVDSNITCNSFSDGGASASATGGTSPYTYAWSNAATTASITGVVAGTYSVTIVDMNGCTSASSVTVVEPVALVSASVVDSNTTCNGLSDGGASASATGGTMPYTYSWSNSATTASITGVVAGTYSVTIMDANGCSSTSAATVTEPTLLVAASVVDSNTTCNGVSDGGASASATGGTMPYTYSWSNAATTASITGVLAGTYTATITDANGCSSTSAATVTQPTILASTIVLDSNTVDGNPNGGASASATGGTMPYTYSWSNAATTASITGVMAGTYSATITDQNGCTDSSSVVIINTLSLTASTVLDSNVSCNGLNDGGATAVPNGTGSPFSYAWSNAATTASITGVAAGTYTVTITDVNSSTATASVTITQPVVLIASSVVDSNVVCFGQANGGASASATGGTTPYAYAWSNAATTASITGIIADTFMVIITDANGCTSTSSVTIVEPPMMTLNIGNDTAVCLNANLVLDAGSGYSSYLWSDNAATQTTVANTAASGSMDYSVTVTNVNGCEAIDTLNVTVNNPAALSIASIADLCAYGSDSLIATLGFTDYLWNTSDTVNSIFVDGTVLGQGSYSYSVTATDTNGCVANASTSFDVYNEVAIDLGPDVTVQWIDGVVESYTLDAGTGYSSYSWNNGNGTNQTYVVTLLNMGHVYLDVTDATGCIGKDTVFVDFILSTPTIEIGQVKVYPNPAYDVLNIEVSNFINAGELDIKIMSITGATVLSSSYTANSGAVKEAIDISKLNPGTYFIEFYANGQKTMKSFIVR